MYHKLIQRICWVILAVMLVFAPFLVHDTGAKVRLFYYLMFVVFSPAALIVWAIDRESTSQEPKVSPQPIQQHSIAGTLVLTGVTTIWIVLYLIANFELFGSSAMEWLNLVADFLESQFTLLQKYQHAHSFGESTRYEPNFDPVTLAKNQVSTVLTMSVGSGCAVLMLWNHFTKTPQERAKHFRDTHNSKETNPLMFVFGVLLSVFALHSTFTGSIELQATPTGKSICLVNFYCYGDDSFLVLIAAILKPLIAYGFCLGTILWIDQLYLEIQGFDLRRKNNPT